MNISVDELFRLLTLAVLTGTMGISIHFRRRARVRGETIARRREGAVMVIGRLVVALPLFLSVVLSVIMPRTMGWATFSLPGWVRWIGAGLGLAAVPVAYWVFSSLGGNVSETVLTKESHTLVTAGPYHWVRHPLYSTGLMLFIGVGLMNANWMVLGMSGVTIVGVLGVVVPREEAQLISRFGDRYQDLMRTTGRLLPRISR